MVALLLPVALIISVVENVWLCWTEEWLIVGVKFIAIAVAVKLMFLVSANERLMTEMLVE